MNVFKNTQTGGLPGGGPGGGFGSASQAGSIMKGAGIEDSGLGRPGVPSGATDNAKEKVSGIKNSMGQFQGRQAGEGASARQTRR